jgi:H+/Cl- antiporter ClcA/CBS domain-containing protein
MSPSATPPRRLLLLTGIAAVLGVLGGFAAWILIHLIALITNLALFHQWGWTVPSFKDLNPSPWIVVAAVCGALLISAMARYAPVIRGHGIPEAMEAVLTKQSRIQPRTAIAKPASAALAIGTGAPFGAEGPIIVTGGSLGSLLGQVIRVSPSERKILLAAGAAAGMAATFGAPLAAVVLAIELLLFEFSTRVFIPLVVAASIAGGMHSWLFGPGPLFKVPPHHYAGLSVLPLFIVLGLGAGVLAAVVSRGLFAVEGVYRRLPVSDFWHPVIGAVIFATIGCFVPRALGVGYDAIGDVLSNKLAVGTVAVLALAKLVAWWAALGSGTSGGTLAPILLISAGYGSLFGAAVDHLFPSMHVSPGAFAVVAMAATFGAATRATFTAIVFVFELTRDYDVILPLMLATVVADLVASVFMHDSIMTEKLTRRGLRVQSSYEVDRFRTVPVRDIMTTAVDTMPDTATVVDARRRFSAGGHSAYPLVARDGRCVAIVTRGDVLGEDAPDDAPLRDYATKDLVSVGPDDLAVTALERMVDEDVEHVPVLVADRLVGICTRTDLFRVRAMQFEAERHQTGWRGAWSWRNRNGGAVVPADDDVGGAH